MRRPVAGLSVLAALVVLQGWLLLLAATPVWADSWAATGQTAYLRSDTASVRLLNGRVLNTGSTRATGAGNSVDVFDPGTETWTATGVTHHSFAYHTLTLLTDGSVLLVGGYDGASTTAVEVWTTGAGAWTEVTPMALAQSRMSHTATRLQDGKVLVAGGCGGRSFPCAPNVQTSAEIYDPDTGAWTAVPDMNVPRSDHSSTLLPDGTVLITGGYATTPAQIFDPVTRTWSNAGTLTRIGSGHAATLLLEGKVLTAGGYTQAFHDVEAYLYEPLAQFWGRQDDMAGSRDRPASVLLDSGDVLVLGGLDGTTPIRSAELYARYTRRWSSAGQMAVGREQPGAVKPGDGTVLVVGGQGRDGGAG